jgi:hypothetical protein
VLPNNLRPTLTGRLLVILLMAASLATSQSTQSPPNDDGYPYGGPVVTTGSLPPSANGSQKHHPQTSTVACPSGDPCVLTGNYDHYRTSVNVNETTLAGYTNWSNFGLKTFYGLSSTPPGTFTFEPVVAQPLYITNVPVSGGGNKNLLIVASLNDNVYAVDTSTGSGTIPSTWPTSSNPNPINLATDCGANATPFKNTSTHQPGAANLAYYGAVATPVIDIGPVDPVAYVVSACTSTFGSTAIHWYLDAIDVQTGLSIAHIQIADATNGFTPANQLARAGLLLTHPLRCVRRGPRRAQGCWRYKSFAMGIHGCPLCVQGQLLRFSRST